MIRLHHYFSFAIASLLLLGCSDPSKNEITLIYPLAKEDVHYCCFAFDWQDNLEGEKYGIKISESSSFDELLLDTTVNAKSIEPLIVFKPQTTYYWQVTALDSELTSNSEFTIIDYVHHLEGAYEANITMYAWNGLEGTTTDTTFSTTLYIWEGDDQSISYNTEHTNGRRNLPFSETLKEDGVLYRIDHEHPRQKDRLSYLFKSDSIFIYSESGGLGGYGYTSIVSKK